MSSEVKQEDGVGRALVGERSVGISNEFISCMGLIDLPLKNGSLLGIGRMYFVVVDFIVFFSQMNEWYNSNLVQFGLKRKISNHLAIMLKEEVKD